MRKLIKAAVLVVLLGLAVIFIRARSQPGERKLLQVKAELRRAGFKVEPKDFNLTIAPVGVIWLSFLFRSGLVF
jgi:hypothetical protein